MGCWDELCLIRGLRPGGGPGSLFGGDLDGMLDQIVQDLVKQGLEIDLDENGLREEIRNLLKMFDTGEDDDEETEYEKAIEEGTISPGPWFPLDDGWDGWDAIAIGAFDEADKDSPSADDTKFRNGYVSYM
jgi:hypothetical protein